MNLQRLRGGGLKQVGKSPKNAVSTRRDAETQAKGIKNAHNDPAPEGVHAVRGAVSKNRV